MSESKHKVGQPSVAWTLTRRFRSQGFGWRGSRLACQRTKEPVAKIRHAA